MLTIIVPLYNEEESVEPLVAQVMPVMAGLGRPYEIILVDDGSKDGTAAAAARLAAANPRVKVINLRRNSGQTAAMMAGFDHAQGEIIIPMDGDLQNDPTDIPRLLAKLDEGYDVVSGWRKQRRDNFVRILPSLVANRLISWISGVHLHDYGCTLKAYRRDVLSGIRLYGELHRFVPIFASWEGGRIAELPVNHHPRRYGASKYGLGRIFKVMFDLLLVRFLTVYETKPIHVFGLTGLVFFAIAGLAGVGALYLKFFEDTAFIQTPLPLLFAIGFMMGIMCVLMGLMTELLVRIYFESQDRTPYRIRSKLNMDG